MKFLSTLIIASLLASCAPTEQTATSSEPTMTMEEITAIIDQTNKKITSLTREGKIEEAAQYFAPDVKQYVAGQAPIEGRGAWIGMQNGIKDFGEWNLQLEVIEVDFNEGMAVERGLGIQTFTANANSPIPSFIDTGNYMVLWKKIDNDWKIQWDYVVLNP